MLHVRQRDIRLNARLHTFVTKVITPVVLVAGLLLLALIHFHGVLAITTTQDNTFNGISAYSSGQLQASFQHNGGTDRPSISYSGVNVLSYIDWSSTVTVDGNVQNLWDNFHGYSQDDAHRQIFSTTSGTGWQVVEVITVVNAHTVTVHYDFVARATGNTSPQQVTLSIFHMHQSYYQPSAKKNVFTADVLPTYVATLTGQQLPDPIGKLSVAVTGPAVPGSALAITDLRSTAAPDGTLNSVASSFTTSYQITNPPVDQLTPLGTETITFAAATATGTPIGAPVTPQP